MMINRWILFYLCLGLILPSFSEARPLQARLDEAYGLYVQAERAESNQERALKFNEALSAYAEVEAEYPRQGQLLFNIANCYFQLGEYGWASLYYWRALELYPRDKRILYNLRVNAEYAGLAPFGAVGPLDGLLFLHSKLSQGERVQVVFVLTLLGFVFWSSWVATRFGILRFFGNVLMVSIILGLLSLAYSQYLAPIEAVLVQAAPLHKDAGAHYAEVLSKPALAGTKVRVLEVREEGNWLKIETPEGIVGFVSSDRLRII